VPHACSVVRVDAEGESFRCHTYVVHTLPLALFLAVHLIGLCLAPSSAITASKAEQGLMGSGLCLVRGRRTRTHHLPPGLDGFLFAQSISQVLDLVAFMLRCGGSRSAAR
jgi:hypothetical protein